MTNTICIAVFLFFSILAESIFPQQLVKRLDVFDARANHLMFVDFAYDQNGKNTGRTVYMSDSTFVRKVLIERGAQGERSKETSINFNDDTIFSATCSAHGDSKSVFIRDRFGMDQLGGSVSYRATGDNFTISQNGADINKMGYEYDEQGNPVKVTVADNSGTLVYYGVFSYGTGVMNFKNVHYQKPIIRLRGNTILTAQFTLNRPAEVRCELTALNGRRTGVLFAGKFPQGIHRKSVRISSTPSFWSADGVYMITLSFDGIVTARSTHVILHGGRSGF